MTGLNVHWIHGSESAKHNVDPDIQVHWYDPNTVILRQNMAVNYEAPFLFLIFGQNRALLLDTGATASHSFFPLRATIDRLMLGWLNDRVRDPAAYELLILHTHAHDDHLAGDGQFSDRPETVLVPADKGSAWRFLGLSSDADQVTLDLGDRIIYAFPTPGHDPSAVTFYDSVSEILFTGDTVYRGRLYVDDWSAFARTIDRLIAFSRIHRVSLVLGCHIEMTRTPGVDFPRRTNFQPLEAPLEMVVEHLDAVRAAVRSVSKPQRLICDDFILWPVDAQT